MKWKVLVLAVVLAAVSVVYSFTPGRDKQPIETRTITSFVMDSFSVTPYTEVEKTYTRVSKIEIYTYGLATRLATGDYTTSDTYIVIPATVNGWEGDNLDFTSLTIKLKENTGAETGTVRVMVHRYTR